MVCFGFPITQYCGQLSRPTATHLDRRVSKANANCASSFMHGLCITTGLSGGCYYPEEKVLERDRSTCVLTGATKDSMSCGPTKDSNRRRYDSHGRRSA